MPVFKRMLLSLLLFPILVFSQQISLSEKMANTVMEIWKDSMAVKPDRGAEWNYEQGVILEGFAGLWLNTANGKFFNYLKKSMDFYVTPSGDIRTYHKGEYNIDHIKTGRALLFLYKVTGELKYYKAARLLREQLSHHPRNSKGGFWHKQIYPNQMWLDGLYMAQPFYAEYAATFNEPESFNDIANQFILMEKHSRDKKTGLLYHGWDESRQQKWADKTSGRSPNFWGRAMGWYGMALVDVLDHFPAEHPKRDSLIWILNRFAVSVKAVQDAKKGLWYQVLDKGSLPDNYLESSASCMFTYTLAKSIRKGYIPASFLNMTAKAFNGIKSEFVEIRSDSSVNLKGTVSVAGLGGNPYRDGSYEYYLKEKVVNNDPKGIGAFMVAANEMEMSYTLQLGKGKTVLLDNYFNHETRTDSTGIIFPHHYVWNQEEQNGFSFFGHIFNRYGVNTTQSSSEPDAALLKKAQIYIIADPDNKKETSDPRFIEEKHVRIIYEWVSKGGVLLLFANDSGHAELKGLNELGTKFGMHFNNESRNMVKGKDFETGAIKIPSNHQIFKSVSKIYLKEICTFNLSPPAKAMLTEGKDIIMATAKIGRGTVFAVGDPWLYNEYLDDRKISAKEFQNYKAAEDLIKWILKQTSGK